MLKTYRTQLLSGGIAAAILTGYLTAPNGW